MRDHRKYASRVCIICAILREFSTSVVRIVLNFARRSERVGPSTNLNKTNIMSKWKCDGTVRLVDGTQIEGVEDHKYSGQIVKK